MTKHRDSFVVLGVLPDGSVNWAVFNERRDRIRSLLDRGRCVGCDGKAPRAEASVYCGDCRRVASDIEDDKRRNICSFCGSAPAGASREPLYADYPVEVVRCHDCRGRKIPETVEAASQGSVPRQSVMSEEVGVIIRDGDHDGEMGQYVMSVWPQSGQDIEDAVKASEMEAWAHNHGPRRHGTLVNGWFVMLSNGWRRIPFRTRFCLCRSRENPRPPRCLVPGVLRAAGLTMARRVDIHY